MGSIWVSCVVALGLAATMTEGALAQTPSPSPSPSETTAPPPECSDGADNDHDGAIDFPADHGCVSELDDSEFQEAPPAPSRVVVAFNQRTHRFVGWVASSLDKCKVNRAVVLYRVEPGRDRALWWAATAASGAWRTRSFPSVHGRFYAIVTEVVVRVEQDFARCLDGRSAQVARRRSPDSHAVFTLAATERSLSSVGEGDSAARSNGRFPVSLSIRYDKNRRQFLGSVRSPRPECRSHSAVVLKRGRPGRDQTIWRASSNDKGIWRSDRFPKARGRFRAVAEPKIAFITESGARLKCPGYKSVTITGRP